MDHKFVMAYSIGNELLPVATKEMNCSSDHFKSKVINIIVGEWKSVVIVEIDGSYPYITNQWKAFIEE